MRGADSWIYPELWSLYDKQHRSLCFPLLQQLELGSERWCRGSHMITTRQEGDMLGETYRLDFIIVFYLHLTWRKWSILLDSLRLHPLTDPVSPIKEIVRSIIVWILQHPARRDRFPELLDWRKHIVTCDTDGKGRFFEFNKLRYSHEQTHKRRKRHDDIDIPTEISELVTCERQLREKSDAENSGFPRVTEHRKTFDASVAVMT